MSRIRLFASAACMSVLFASMRASIGAEALPAVAKPQVNAAVTLIDQGQAWVLDNGIVKATINKRNGNMVALVYKGINTMGGGGYWEQTPSGTVTQTVTIDPAKNNGDRAEVDVKGVTGGRGMDIEVRYALGRGESGIYAYGIFSHPASYGRMGEGESRYIAKLNHDFNWISVDADRNMLECTPQDWGAGTVIHAKEQRVQATGYYKNTVEHKYSYNAIQYKIPAWGWSSTKDHLGVFFINPTTEYLAGGSSKMELVAHFDANENPDPIILNYWTGGHYAGGASASIPQGEEWNKVIGPIFVYCTSLADPKDPSAADMATLQATAGNPTVPQVWKDNGTALWQDALSQAKTERAAWPYEWVRGVDYPHKDQRANVTGQLVLDDSQAATKELPGLTVGLAHPDYPGGSPRAANNGIVTWPHDGNYYQFWNDGTPDGKFTLTNVRPGHYTLHAFADGVLGEYAKTDITVEAGKPLDLGKLTWTPVRNGKQIWEIGYPNRNASEFYKGDGENYWLWGWYLRYGAMFPNDITYTVGKSDWHKDWFIEQVPHAPKEQISLWENPEAKDPLNQRFGWMKTWPKEGADPWSSIGRGAATTWTIKFNMNAASKGEATLRIALGGADGGGGLAIGVNGQAVGAIHPIATNALRYNTDRGVWREYAQKFDAGLLKAGENSMTLTVPAGDLTTGVVYDYLRLELKEN